MEKTDWSDKMDELELMWPVKMATPRLEYQKVREILNKRRLILDYRASTFRTRDL